MAANIDFTSPNFQIPSAQILNLLNSTSPSVDSGSAPMPDLSSLLNLGGQGQGQPQPQDLNSLLSQGNQQLPQGNGNSPSSPPTVEQLRATAIKKHGEAMKAAADAAAIATPTQPTGLPRPGAALLASLAAGLLQSLSGKYSNAGNETLNGFMRGTQAGQEHKYGLALNDANTQRNVLNTQSQGLLGESQMATNTANQMATLQNQKDLLTQKGQDAQELQRLRNEGSLNVANTRARKGDLTAAEAPMLAILKSSDANPSERAQAYYSLRSLPDQMFSGGNNPYSNMTDDQITHIAGQYNPKQISQFAKAKLLAADAAFKIDQNQRENDKAPSVIALNKSRANLNAALGGKANAGAALLRTENNWYPASANAKIQNLYAQATNLQSLSNDRTQYGQARTISQGIGQGLDSIAKQANTWAQMAGHYTTLLKDPTLDADTKKKYQGVIDQLNGYITSAQNDSVNLRRAAQNAPYISSQMKSVQAIINAGGDVQGAIKQFKKNTGIDYPMTMQGSAPDSAQPLIGQ